MEPIAIGTPIEEDAEHELLVYAGVREVEQVGQAFRLSMLIGEVGLIRRR